MKSFYNHVKTLLTKSLLATLVVCFNSVANNSALAQNPAWILAPKNFNIPGGWNTSLPTTPPGDGYQGQATSSVHNMQLDAQGNILFFVADGVVYDKDGYELGRLTGKGSGMNYTVYGNAEIIIAPDPSNCSRYYIIGQGYQSLSSYANHYPFYSILDMSQFNDFYTSRKGKLIPLVDDYYTAFNIKDISPGYVKLSDKMGGISTATTKLRNNNSRLVFINNGFSLFRYRIDASGFHYENSYAFPYSSGNAIGNNQDVRAEMELIELSNGNYRIATVFRHENSSGTVNQTILYCADLDLNGNVIPSTELTFASNTSSLDQYKVPYVHGLEFSPNGNILYVTHETTALYPNSLEYYDFSNSSAGFQAMFTNSDFKNSQIELGTDGKLYYITHNRMATLSNPNNPNMSNWNNNAIPVTYTPNNRAGTVPSNSTDILKTYILPDQIDGMDYNAHFFANTQCCLTNQWYSAEAFTATTNATWQPGAGNNPFGSTNGVVYIKDALIIPADKNITIKNMVFKFAPDAKVIVARSVGGIGGLFSGGGKLTLDGTTFTVDDRCAPTLMWLGVQVYGYNNTIQTAASQYIPVKQGTLTLKNNAIIEHAQFGVDLAKLNFGTFWGMPAYIPDLDYTGGVIYADNSTFRNNMNDVRFWDYAAPGNIDNVSYFSNCTFVTTNTLKDPTKIPQYHVYLQNVTGVKFYGNDFKNTAPTAFNYDKRGYGIYSANSKLYVDARCTSIFYPCSGYDPNVFQNLYCGIYATSTDATRTIRSDRNKYVNNIYGIRLYGQNFSTVIRNDFEVLRSKAPNPTISTYGLLLQNSTGYQVEENTFKEYNDPNVSGVGNSVGIIVSNSGEVDNVIYRNTFSNLNVGGQSQEINAPVLPSGGWNSSLHGLKWKCNTFTGNMQTADLLVTSGRIDYQQGYLFSPSVDPVQATKAPAGNKFSHSTNNTENDIKVNSTAQQFQYIHHSDYITKPINYTTSKVSPYMNFNIFFPVAFNGNSCPSNLSSGGVFELQQMTAKMDSLDALITEKETLLSHVNTEELNNDVSAKDAQKDVSLDVLLNNEIGFLKSNRSYWVYEKIRAIIADTTLKNTDELVEKILISENITLPTTKLPMAKLSEEQFAEIGVLRHFLAPITEGFEIPIIEKAEPSLTQIQETENQMETINYLSIYPNPKTTVASTTIALQNVSNEDVTAYSVEIYDLSLYGKQWVNQNFSANQTILNIPNNVLKAGFYVVKLFQNGQLVEMKTLRVD
ncbi:MAG TPA: T9SS type A sorting domain-containing protein [Crocinitomicaceae bacterium]|nr:T9SS type A sorting domain-containing protein [Crocinitomicaceae bacterium]